METFAQGWARAEYRPVETSIAHIDADRARRELYPKVGRLYRAAAATVAQNPNDPSLAELSAVVREMKQFFDVANGGEEWS